MHQALFTKNKSVFIIFPLAYNEFERHIVACCTGLLCELRTENCLLLNSFFRFKSLRLLFAKLPSLSISNKYIGHLSNRHLLKFTTGGDVEIRLPLLMDQ